MSQMVLDLANPKFGRGIESITVEGRISSLEEEVSLMQKCIEEKLCGFVPYKQKGAKEEDLIFNLFKKASRAKVDLREEEKMRQVIRNAIVKNKPIKVSFLWACGGQARSPYKLLQWQMNFPRAGDVWAIYWLQFLHQRVSHYHQPGLEIVIVDEGPLLEILGWTKEEIASRRKILESFISSEFPIKIVNLPDNFSLEGITVDPPVSPEIIAIISFTESLLSQLSSEEIEEIHRDLYVKREKDYNRIRNIIPDSVWDQAVQIRTKMAKIGLARKKTDWIQEQVFAGEEYIDAAITEKGRWTPDIWSFTFPQHGGSLVVRDSAKYSVRILPEYRLKEDSGLKPVFISEFSKNDSPLIFRWEEKS